MNRPFSARFPSLVVAASLGLALLCGLFGSALAHPLGNFTINRYVRLAPGQGEVQALYIVDMAEMPTHAERNAIDLDDDGLLSPMEIANYRDHKSAELADNLVLTADGLVVPWHVADAQLTFPAGQAGLPTLRLTLALTAKLPAEEVLTLDYHDRNFADRIGWQEVVVQPGSGVRLLESTAPETDVSRQLTDYPQDLLNDPPQVRSATVRLAVSGAVSGAVRAPAIAAAAMAPAGIVRPSDPFADLVTIPDLAPLAVALALAAAVGWGAVHALSPGHGKTIVAAYLVGTRGTARHAMFLGLTTTVTHTAGVFALGFVTLALSRFILPEQLYPWMSTLSGVLVLVIGLTMIRDRLRLSRRPTADGHAHGHEWHTVTVTSTVMTMHDHGHAHAQVDGHHGDGELHAHDSAQLHEHRTATGMRTATGIRTCRRAPMAGPLHGVVCWYWASPAGSCPARPRWCSCSAPSA